MLTAHYTWRWSVEQIRVFVDSPHVCLQAQRFIVDHLWSCKVKKTPMAAQFFSLNLFFLSDVYFIGFTDFLFFFSNCLIKLSEVCGHLRECLTSQYEPSKCAVHGRFISLLVSPMELFDTTFSTFQTEPTRMICKWTGLQFQP